MNIRRFAITILALSALAPIPTKTWAQGTTSRLALVIGEAQYRDGPLATAANDGGLMADLLRQAGFDVTGAANLSQDQIRATFREFLEKAAAAGPQAEIFVYLSGKGVQFAGENYFVPIEATIANSASVPAETIRLADFTGPLDSMPARARVVVLDIGRPNNFGRTGEPLASGLTLVDAAPNSLVALNTAPGTLAPDENGPYGVYAQTLVEMLRQPGLPLNEAFAQLRLRVNQTTRGAQTPFNVSKLSANYSLFAPAPGAPAIASAPIARAKRPMRDVPPAEAYGYAVESDTYQAYDEFLAVYPNDPLARRVRAMQAARREALTWRRTYLANTPEAYWTYLRRYPNGPHSADAGRRLSFIRAALAPPPQFREYDAYDIPPPPRDEIILIDRPRYFINEVVDVPPPRYGDDFLPPIPREYRDLPPPPPPPRAGFLPIPVPIPIPFARPQQQQPGFVTAPRFVQQPVAPAGGGVAPQAAPIPQGYTAAPPAGGRPQRGPEAGAPVAPTLAPVTPGAAPIVAPNASPGPAGTPPSQALPRPSAAPAPNGTPGTAPTPPAGAPPSQVLPRPERPAGGPGSPPTGLPPAGERPTTVPQTAPSQSLPRSERPVVEPGTRPSGERPAGERPTGPQTTPSQTLPSPNGAGQPASRPAGESLRPTTPTGSPPARETPPAARPTTPTPVPSVAPSPRETPPAARPTPPAVSAPPREPVAPRAAPPEPREMPRAAPQEPRETPRAAPPAVAPRAAPPEPREIPRAAPPEPREAPRAAPPAAAPRAAPAPGGGEGRGGGGGEGRGGREGGEGRGGGGGEGRGPGGGERRGGGG